MKYIITLCFICSYFLCPVIKRCFIHYLQCIPLMCRAAEGEGSANGLLLRRILPLLPRGALLWRRGAAGGPFLRTTRRRTERSEPGSVNMYIYIYNSYKLIYGCYTFECTYDCCTVAHSLMPACDWSTQSDACMWLVTSVYEVWLLCWRIYTFFLPKFALSNTLRQCLDSFEMKIWSRKLYKFPADFLAYTPLDKTWLISTFLLSVLLPRTNPNKIILAEFVQSPGQTL